MLLLLPLFAGAAVAQSEDDAAAQTGAALVRIREALEKISGVDIATLALAATSVLLLLAIFILLLSRTCCARDKTHAHYVQSSRPRRAVVYA